MLYDVFKHLRRSKSQDRTLADVFNTCDALNKLEHLPMFLNTCGALKFKFEHLPMFLNTCGALKFKVEHLAVVFNTCGAL